MQSVHREKLGQAPKNLYLKNRIKVMEFSTLPRKTKAPSTPLRSEDTLLSIILPAYGHESANEFKITSKNIQQIKKFIHFFLNEHMCSRTDEEMKFINSAAHFSTMESFHRKFSCFETRRFNSNEMRNSFRILTRNIKQS